MVLPMTGRSETYALEVKQMRYFSAVVDIGSINFCRVLAFISIL